MGPNWDGNGLAHGWSFPESEVMCGIRDLMRKNHKGVQIDEWSQLTFESICGFNPGLTLTDSQEGFLQRVGICNENGTPPSQFMSPGGYSCGVDTSYKLVYNPIEL